MWKLYKFIWKTDNCNKDSELHQMNRIHQRSKELYTTYIRQLPKGPYTKKNISERGKYLSTYNTNIPLGVQVDVTNNLKINTKS